MNLREKLEELDACTEAIEWVGDRTLNQAWAECKRANWMLWLLVKIEYNRKTIVRCACACARTSLQYVPEGEDRPRKAIETAEAWARGEATEEEVRNTATAAYASSAAAGYAAYAYAATAAYAASAAAYAAAYASADYAASSAYASAYATAATYAASAASSATAAYVAADYAALAEMADIIRSIVPEIKIEDVI